MSDKITRRDAARALGAGVTAFPILSAAPPYAMKVFTPAQAEDVAALAEAIIPATTTPGARAAGVHEYIDQTLANDQDQAESFQVGLKWIQEKSGKPFSQLDAAAQTALLTPISDAQPKIAPEDKPGAAFFRQLKLMVLNGYYLSRVGLEQEVGYKGNSAIHHFKGCD